MQTYPFKTQKKSRLWKVTLSVASTEFGTPKFKKGDSLENCLPII